MSQRVSIVKALCVSEIDNTALVTGRSIAVLSSMFNRREDRFALCPDSEFSQAIAWAEVLICKRYRGLSVAETLSWHTIYSQSFLQELIEEKRQIWLNVLRVYQLANPIILDSLKTTSKAGKFIRIPTALDTSLAQPVLSDFVFRYRYKRLVQLSPPEHPELETLQSKTAHYTQTNPAAKALETDISVFLGWADPQPTTATSPNWVKEITTSGNSSDGHLFEKRVRQGFIQLGFTNNLNNIKASLDPEATGGDGGIDFYCELPYPIVGECKASKDLKVSDNKDGAAFQLIKLGQKHLYKEGFDRAIKIIMAPGKLTKAANQTAIGNQMNIMRPETLQRLVELKNAHPGSIDLLALEPCLRSAPFGTDADQKVNDFIDSIEQQIKIRSRVIESVKALKEGGDDRVSASTVRTHFNAIQPDKLGSPEEAHDILVELSSPLTGYLGKIKGETWQADRFYFLRDLTMP